MRIRERIGSCVDTMYTPMVATAISHEVAVNDVLTQGWQEYGYETPGQFLQEIRESTRKAAEWAGSIATKTAQSD